MKVLVYTFHSYKDITANLHLNFLQGLKRHCEEYNVYGHQQMWDHPTKSIKHTALKLYKKHKPDIVIMYASGGFPKNYFAKLPCAKVLIETDYYKKEVSNNLKWYNTNRFDLILQRGTYKTVDIGIPMVWLPFSANENIFYPGNEKRKMTIGFAGNDYHPTFYMKRRNAIEKLVKNNMMINKGRKLWGNSYPLFLRSIIGALTSTEMIDSPTIRTPRGKMFEIMASGTVLLTPSFTGEDRLFGTTECYVKYREDCSDLVDKAKRIIEDREYADGIAKRGLSKFKEKHTHRIRVKELYDHLYRLLGGVPVKRIWGL